MVGGREPLLSRLVKAGLPEPEEFQTEGLKGEKDLVIKRRRKSMCKGPEVGESLLS